MPSESYKILLVGPRGAGKTTWVEKISTGNFNEKPMPTYDVEITPVVWHLSNGTYYFNIWELSDHTMFSTDENRKYFTGASAAIVMVDVTDKDMEAKLEKYTSYIKSKTGDSSFQILAYANKVDKQSNIAWEIDTISVKNCYHLKQPIFDLLHVLFKDNKMPIETKGNCTDENQTTLTNEPVDYFVSELIEAKKDNLNLDEIISSFTINHSILQINRAIQELMKRVKDDDANAGINAHMDVSTKKYPGTYVLPSSKGVNIKQTN